MKKLLKNTSAPTLTDEHAKRIENAFYFDSSVGGEANQMNTDRDSPTPKLVPPRTQNSAEAEPMLADTVLLERSVKVVCGNSHRQLAEIVCELLGISTHNVKVSQFTNGEVRVSVAEEVVGSDVYIIQPTCASDSGETDVNTALMELLLLVRKMKLAYAKRITAIVPYLAYSRQDRKTDLRVPISASAVAQMITKMGVDRVVSMDLHSGQIQGYFNSTPLDNLLMVHEFALYLSSQAWFEPNRSVIVSPDAGGVERAKKLADVLKVGRIVTIVKRRVEAGNIDSMQCVGEVDGLNCIIVDDMCDTGGTLVKACALLKTMGAARVVACVTHGLLTDPCAKRVNECDALQELVVSDSIPQQEHQKRIPDKLTVLTIAPLLATAIIKYAKEESVSSLFDQNPKLVASASPSPSMSKQRTPGSITSPASLQSSAPGSP